MKRLFLITAFAACTPVCAQGVLSIGGGADYSSGEYGKVETTSVSMVYLNAKYETGRWTYRATLPYLRISGPANVVGVGTDVIVLPDAPAGRRDVSGAGDITAAKASSWRGSMLQSCKMRIIMHGACQMQILCAGQLI